MKGLTRESKEGVKGRVGKVVEWHKQEGSNRDAAKRLISDLMNGNKRPLIFAKKRGLTSSLSK